MLLTSQIIAFIKFLGANFFIWSMPTAIIVLNILKSREIFDMNVLIAFVAGLVLNVIWDFMNLYMDKKEYHKNLL